jgi:hypothetical protein
MRILILCLAVFVGGLSAAAAADSPRYEDLVARAERGDTALDYTALRNAYAMSEGYDPYGMRSKALFSAAWKAFESGDCTTALSSARAMFAINYITIPMHFVVGDCLRRAGDAAGADREVAIGRGLADSLRDSGDGKSMKTAYKVVTLSEEGFVLTMLGFKEEQQSLLRDKDGHQYDLIEGKDEKTGEMRHAYFNVDALFAGMAKSLGLKEGGP